MSHELRTPLNAIIGFSEIMGSGLFGALGSDKYQEYCHDILTSGTYLLEVINDILDMSKIEAGRLKLEPETVELDKILADALRVVSGRAQDKRLMMSSKIVPGIAFQADRRALKQIALNLLSNAVKFTPGPGLIAVSTTLRDDGRLALVVADSGIGMTGEELALALQPFRQIDGSLTRRHTGTGLGLSIVRKLASLLGGDVALGRFGLDGAVCGAGGDGHGGQRLRALSRSDP